MSWPEPPDWLELDVRPRRLPRGGTITVGLRAPRDELADHRRELGLACLAHRAAVHQSGEGGDAGGRFRMDRQEIVWADWRLLEPADNYDPFEFTVPPDAPYSYEGDVASFYWGIWLRAEFRLLDREAYLPLFVDP